MLVMDQPLMCNLICWTHTFCFSRLVSLKFNAVTLKCYVQNYLTEIFVIFWFSYSVWKHVACNKLQISEDLAWL